MARPRKQLDPKSVVELAAIGCTMDEIGRVLGCDGTTIGRRFRSEIECGFAHLKVSLRRRQLELAMDGNATMLIWLGKQYLNQTDSRKTEMQQQVTEPAVEDTSAEEQEARLHELLEKGGFRAESKGVTGTQGTFEAKEKAQE